MTAHGARSKRRRERSALTRRNSTTETGRFNSVRNDGELRIFRNYPQFMHLTILDVHPDVETFVTECEPLELRSGTSFRPHVIIGFADHVRLTARWVERKHKLKADSGLRARLSEYADACERHDIDFEVVHDGYWKDPIRWANSCLLRQSARRAHLDAKNRVRELLREGPLSIAELMRESSLGFEGKFAALALCAERTAAIERDRMITDQTLVELL